MENIITFAESLGYHLFDFQQELLTKLEKHQYNAILSSRQMGITTILSILIAYKITNQKILDKPFNVGFITPKAANSIEFLRRISKLLQQLDIMHTCNGKELNIKNGGCVYALKTSDLAETDEKNFIKLEKINSLNLIITDNHAYFSDSELKFVNRVVKNAPTASIAFVTTGGGPNIKEVTKFFKDNYLPFVNSKIIWSQFPGRDETWTKDIIRIIGQENFDNEYDLKNAVN